MPKDKNTHPIKIVFNDDNNTITETWKLKDSDEVITKKYTLEIINEGEENEEVTKIIFPDNSEMALEGFLTRITVK